MWQVDYSWEGFQWIVPDDNQQSVIAFLRRDAEGKMVMAVCNSVMPWLIFAISVSESSSLSLPPSIADFLMSSIDLRASLSALFACLITLPMFTEKSIPLSAKFLSFWISSFRCLT